MALLLFEQSVLYLTLFAEREFPRPNEVPHHIMSEIMAKISDTSRRYLIMEIKSE